MTRHVADVFQINVFLNSDNSRTEIRWRRRRHLTVRNDAVNTRILMTHFRYLSYLETN